ncbi:MAG: geranylgeranylglyceryl/heptaprenylglyceryl phosphate synthase [Bacteroidales bacterium]|nr:geranylgeranylglyceryl/heptaprenylglyceryl phosphate synthase [Bacteroidales bacterium]
MNDIYQKYFNKDRKRIAVLLDPDKLDSVQATRMAEKIEKSPADIILVGGSLVSASVDDTVNAIKQATGKPVVLFPGGGNQLSPYADALLLLSLVSGRNPEYLIGEHVKSSYKILKSGIEIISTAYVLIDGGAITSVQYVSNTMPIPANKPDLAVATALAGEQIGMKNIYLEAGSGALNPVSEASIRAVSSVCKSHLMVGGGMRSMQAIEKAFNAGADMAVIGTAFEKNPDFFNS